jgi:hypothetical protein
MVEKIRDIEDPERANYGQWRNRMLLVADDDRQGPKIDPIRGSNAHYRSSDKVGEKILSRWPSVDMRKVYLFEYEMNEVFEKPAAAQALINEINNGVAYINYFGHGADILWADEHVLLMEDVSRLHNSKRYPVVSSFSCSVGKFDLPGHQSLTERLVLEPDAGAIVGIASAREAYAGANEKLAISFYSLLFDTTVNRSVGRAYMQAKINEEDNARSYAYFGDPSIELLKLNHRIQLEIVDEKDKSVDTLMALQRVKVNGKVVGKSSGKIDREYGGSGDSAFVHVGLFNPFDSTTRKDGGDKTGVNYTMPGTPLFVGKTLVREGKFEQSFLLPLNASFDKSGVRLVAYAWEGEDGAVGYDTNFIIHGTQQTDIDDTLGPEITVRKIYDESRFNSELSFADRIVSSLPMKCEIIVEDENGVDVMGVAPDNGLTFGIEGAMRKQNINHRFQFIEGDYRKGSAVLTFEEDELEEGLYTMEITAQDLLGNFSSRQFGLEIRAPEEVALTDVFNIPNPMRVGGKTAFFFFPSIAKSRWYDIDVKVTIRIYSLSGKLLTILYPTENGYTWDGTDYLGNMLGPNIYLYRVSAESSDFTTPVSVHSDIMKLVIHPPKK